MKRINLLFISFFIFTFFSFSNCNKNSDNPQLPPATTIGANTFGCLVDGKVFVPKDGRGKPGLYCQYIYNGSGPNGGWHLNIPAYNYSTNKGISILTDSLLLEDGKTYTFKYYKKGFPDAFYMEDVSNGVNVYLMLESNIGNLTITKFDKQNKILSGTFYFIGTNTTTGKTVNVTDGRFDIRY